METSQGFFQSVKKFVLPSFMQSIDNEATKVNVPAKWLFIKHFVPLFEIFSFASAAKAITVYNRQELSQLGFSVMMGLIIAMYFLARCESHILGIIYEKYKKSTV